MAERNKLFEGKEMLYTEVVIESSFNTGPCRKVTMDLAKRLQASFKGKLAGGFLVKEENSVMSSSKLHAALIEEVGRTPEAVLLPLPQTKKKEVIVKLEGGEGGRSRICFVVYGKYEYITSVLILLSDIPR